MQFIDNKERQTLTLSLVFRPALLPYSLFLQGVKTTRFVVSKLKVIIYTLYL